MKILVVGFAKIKYMPYANFYLDNIDQKAHNVHLVYWNRDLKEEDTSRYADVTLHEFRCYQEDNVSQKSKIGSFLKFRKYVKKVLAAEKFDFVIVLHSMAGVLLQDIWVRKFKNRFIFDYRDSTYERYSFYKHMIGKLIRRSKVTFTSSDGFRVLFPQTCENKIYTTHNILAEDLSHRDLQHIPHEKIRISFWGLVREEGIEREIISKFAKDTRFELHYYGREQATAKKLKAYAQNIQARNVFFHGEYKPVERYGFACSTELIHNLYRSANMMMAVSNKYYDGSIFYIPQLCMKGSFMGNKVENCGIGLACDPWESDFTERVYQYYVSLNKEQFTANCDAEMVRVTEEYQKAVDTIRGCLESV